MDISVEEDEKAFKDLKGGEFFSFDRLWEWGETSCTLYLKLNNPSEEGFNVVRMESWGCELARMEDDWPIFPYRVKLQIKGS